jgi:hypothetical protein
MVLDFVKKNLALVYFRGNAIRVSASSFSHLEFKV